MSDSVFDSPTTFDEAEELMRESRDRLMRFILYRLDDALQELLGRWISELEPVLFMRQYGFTDLPWGVGFVGHDQPTIYFPGMKEFFERT
jgi:hypothetical protein